LRVAGGDILRRGHLGIRDARGCEHGGGGEDHHVPASRAKDFHDRSYTLAMRYTTQPVPSCPPMRSACSNRLGCPRRGADGYCATSNCRPEITAAAAVDASTS